MQSTASSLPKSADDADGADENGGKRVRVLRGPGSRTAERNLGLNKPGNEAGSANEELL
jgi:hypothetical protein